MTAISPKLTPRKPPRRIVVCLRPILDKEKEFPLLGRFKEDLPFDGMVELTINCMRYDTPVDDCLYNVLDTVVESDPAKYGKLDSYDWNAIDNEAERLADEISMTCLKITDAVKAQDGGVDDIPTYYDLVNWLTPTTALFVLDEATTDDYYPS